ncbi:MAG: beta-Ala-His dipeptidase [Promethearchaeota archaeon]|nr:MAG: beta-Ala-His dipeptidase [Candidatus Lokiarchaeota archaeon]
MTENLLNLGSPSEFWEYFEQISKIPHCSGNEGEVREFIREEAEKFNFETKIDKAGNILVIIPPKKEKKSIIIIQSHMDMVCEKNKDVEHDFTKDPLKLKIITIDGKKWLTAEGTTLGADNATGMAYSLALMKKIHDGELNFESLEIDLLFTVGEETGMFGAMQIDKELLRSNLLINLDSFRENFITIGCVGALITSLEVKVDLIEIKPIEEGLISLKINLTGLLGGHSGGDIHRGRANAIKLIAKVLWKINKNLSIYIKSIDGGGTNRNAIPREANAVIYIKKNHISKIRDFLDNIMLEIKEDYSKIEDDIIISILETEIITEDAVFSKDFQDKFLGVLLLFPHGPISMHPEFDNLVHTSTNLASIITRKNRIKIETLQRSFNSRRYNEISDQINELFNLTNLKIKFKKVGGFGEWNPNFDSLLLKYVKEVYEDLLDDNFIITAVHGGLEPGVFKMHHPDLDMITIGPTLDFLHSPDERLDIQSVDKFWNIFIALLGKINKK